MSAVIMYSASCDCGWNYGPVPKVGLDPAVKHHKSHCALWIKS